MSKVTEYLKKENVRIVEAVEDWREAIRVATEPLAEQGYITENYAKRIIQLTEEHGAYYIVAKNLALVHARPEDGVLKQQLAEIMMDESRVEQCVQAESAEALYEEITRKG